MFQFLVRVALTLLVLAPTVEAKTLRVAIPTLPSLGLNPLAATNLPTLYTTGALFDALTWVDNGGIAKPQLAESWSAKDERTWTFKLRSGVVFSDGEPLTADSVAFWINLMETPEGAGWAVHAEIGSLKARALDPLTLEVVTPVPNPFLPHELSLVRVMSPAHWKKVGAQGVYASPVGTGPFVMEKLEDRKMILKAAPKGWRKPVMDTLELVAATDAGPRLSVLLSGGVDIAVQLGPDDVDTVQSAGMKMVAGREPSVITLSFINVKDGPQKDVRVRQALNYAVDKEAIVKNILGGFVDAASQPVPSVAFGYDPELKPYPHDPARAKKLLADAGYPNGFKVVAESFTGTSAYTAFVFQQVAADLAKVGVTLEIRSVPAPKYARGIFSGDWEGTAVAIDYNTSPSLDALRAFRRHSCLWPKPWYCDETLMPLLNQAMSTFDLDKRRELTKQVLRHQRDQASAIFIHDQPRFDAISPKVKNYRITVGYIPYAELDVTN